MTFWNPPVELTRGEVFIAKRCEKRRVFVFLRELRHVIFDAEMQDRLNAAYSSAVRGKDRVCPAQLALADVTVGALPGKRCVSIAPEHIATARRPKGIREIGGERDAA